MWYTELVQYTAHAIHTIKSLPFSSSSSLSQTLKLEDLLVAKEFNNYFGEVGVLLADKIKNSKENTFKTFIPQRISSSLFLNQRNSAEVLNIISSLKISKSSGYDNISFFFKSAIKVVAFPLLTYWIAHLNWMCFLTA